MKKVLRDENMDSEEFIDVFSRNVANSEMFGTPLIQRLLMRTEQENDIDSVQCGKEVVTKYVETLKGKITWYDLDEERECRAVMVVWLCNGQTVATVAAKWNYVELFLNEHSVSKYNECNVHFE